MGPDLAGFLTVIGGLLDGDGLTWSIGGPAKQLSIPLIGTVLGQPQGISGSHNKYECDASPTRGDLFTAGNDFTLQMDQYKQLENMARANGDVVDIGLLNQFRSMRFDQSVQTVSSCPVNGVFIAEARLSYICSPIPSHDLTGRLIAPATNDPKQNPYFFNGPFTGVLVQPAAYYFIYRFMANKSSSHPNGLLTTTTLRSLFSITQAKDGTLVHTPGHERIPSNFYKRALGDEYSIPSLGGDIIRGAEQHPKFLTIGGNTGAVNTLAGVDLEDLTGGIFNVKNLLQGNNLFCFASQIAVQVLPDQLECSGLISGLTSVLASVQVQLAQLVGSLGCPQLGKVQFGQFDGFPGYKNLDCRTGTY